MFITFDGPNGAGKSTLISEVKKVMEADGYKVYITREPSHSNIGQFIRNSEEKYSSYVLANLVAADRHSHLNDEILPQLASDAVVLCDRYVASSLILQVLDGLSMDEVMKINTGITKPDICFFLIAKEETLSNRLALRRNLTRFEREFTSKEELDQSIKAGKFLLRNGYVVQFIDTDQEVSISVEKIRSSINELIKKPLG